MQSPPFTASAQMATKGVIFTLHGSVVNTADSWRVFEQQRKILTLKLLENWFTVSKTGLLPVKEGHTISRVNHN